MTLLSLFKRWATCTEGHPQARYRRMPRVHDLEGYCPHFHRHSSRRGHREIVVRVTSAKMLPSDSSGVPK